MEKERDKQLKVSIILKYSLVDDKPIQESISFSILSFSPWQTSKCMPLRGKYDSNICFVQPYINPISIYIPFIKQISLFYMDKKKNGSHFPSTIHMGIQAFHQNPIRNRLSFLSIPINGFLLLWPLTMSLIILWKK